MTEPTTWCPSDRTAAERLKGRLFATTTEAAAVLCADHRTVRAAIERGEIPAFKVGANWRIPTAWLFERALLVGSDDAA